MIIDIAVDRIVPHPDNPRKDLGEPRWSQEQSTTLLLHSKNKELDLIYNLLTALGYEMSDEENALRDGTHALFEG